MDGLVHQLELCAFPVDWKNKMIPFSDVCIQEACFLTASIFNIFFSSSTNSKRSALSAIDSRPSRSPGMLTWSQIVLLRFKKHFESQTLPIYLRHVVEGVKDVLPLLHWWRFLRHGCILHRCLKCPFRPLWIAVLVEILFGLFRVGQHLICWLPLSLTNVSNLGENQKA